MANEIANRSHAGLILQVFADGTPAIITAAWGVEVATLQKLSTGVYAARLTHPLGLTLDPTGGGARFGFIVTTQGLALPNFAQGFVIPDPFPTGPPPPVGPGDTIGFSWVSVQTVTPANLPIDADGFINLEVRRVPGERRR